MAGGLSPAAPLAAGVRVRAARRGSPAPWLLLGPPSLVLTVLFVLPIGLVLVTSLTEHLGGALARVPADATAFVHRRAPFDLIVIAGGFRPEETERNFAWARGVSSAMRAFMSGGAYVNYLGADADADTVRAAYGPRGTGWWR